MQSWLYCREVDFYNGTHGLQRRWIFLNADKEYTFSVGFARTSWRVCRTFWLDLLQMDVNDTEAMVIGDQTLQNFLLDEKQQYVENSSL